MRSQNGSLLDSALTVSVCWLLGGAWRAFLFTLHLCCIHYIIPPKCCNWKIETDIIYITVPNKSRSELWGKLLVKYCTFL